MTFASIAVKKNYLLKNHQVECEKVLENVGKQLAHTF